MTTAVCERKTDSQPREGRGGQRAPTCTMWLLTLVSGESREERDGFTSSRDSEPLSRCVEPLCEDAPAGVLVSLREREEKY